jgi:hypothetical protein
MTAVLTFQWISIREALLFVNKKKQKNFVPGAFATP